MVSILENSCDAQKAFNRILTLWLLDQRVLLAILCSPGVLLGNMNTLSWLGKVPDLSLEDTRRSRHHLDSTDPAKSPPRGVWLTSPSWHREERKGAKNSFRLYLGSGWPEATDWRNSIILKLLNIDGNQLTKYALDEALLCFEDVITLLMRY